QGELAAFDAVEERADETPARGGALVVHRAAGGIERAARLRERDGRGVRDERETPATRPRGLVGGERREREESAVAAEAARHAKVARGAQACSMSARRSCAVPLDFAATRDIARAVLR